MNLTDKQVYEIAQLCGAYEDEGSYFCGTEEGYPVITHSDLKKKLEEVLKDGSES